jgi:hypothetical protein
MVVSDGGHFIILPSSCPLFVLLQLLSGLVFALYLPTKKLNMTGRFLSHWVSYDVNGRFCFVETQVTFTANDW